MRLLDYFRSSKKKSASVAKERLQILVAHERASKNQPSYLPQLKQELLAMKSERNYYKSFSVSTEYEKILLPIKEKAVAKFDFENFDFMKSTFTELFTKYGAVVGNAFRNLHPEKFLR